MRTFSVLFSSLCTRPPFIKDLNLPSCVNCVHFLDYQRRDSYDYDKNHDLGGCAKFGTKNMVSGEIKYDFASTCRIDKTRCGEKGAYYNPIVKNP